MLLRWTVWGSVAVLSFGLYGLAEGAEGKINSPLIKSLCRRDRVIVAEDKARDRVESGDSGRERNAVIRPQGPDAARMVFFNGLLDTGGARLVD